MTRSAYLTNPLYLDATASAVQVHCRGVEAAPLGETLPGTVRRWLARLRLLEGVPFAHLVVDSELLPPESIRCFYLDREWTDTLVQGALAVGTVTTLDREDLQALHARIREEVDTEERKVRLVGGDAPGTAPPETISGFLLRSRMVSGWPALHVRGYRREVGRDDAPVAEDEPARLRILRLERLAPAVLLCLFDGVPEVVHLEEPRQGLQFGVDLVAGAAGTAGARVPLRDVTTGSRLDLMQPPPAGPTDVEVPFRRGAPGVIHLTELTRRIAAQPATHVDDFGGVGSAELAMEMLQFPFRQVFGDPERGTVPGERIPDYGVVFNPSIGIEVIREWIRGGGP